MIGSCRKPLTDAPASLQIPYLLNVAGEFNAWIEPFPPSPAPTLSILRKLDHCFASLLMGQDFDTKETLPGFENGLRAGMSRTDMVRCNSTVQQARAVVLRLAVEEPEVQNEQEEVRQLPTDDETESDWDGPADWGQATAGEARSGEEEELSLLMDVARVYEKTLVQLGKTLFKGVPISELARETPE